MNRRAEQVAATLQRAVQEVLARGLSDPRISGLITITGVTVSDDLKAATVSVSVFPEEREKLTMHGLQAAAKHIRRKAAELVALNQLPELAFRLDKSVKREAEVLQALAKARASAGTHGEAGGSGSGGGASSGEPGPGGAPTNADTDRPGRVPGPGDVSEGAGS